MNYLGANTSGGCFNESKRIFGSFDPKYYDEIITKLNLLAREEYERSMQHLLQNQKTQGEGLLHNQKKKKRILVVDDEIDICMAYQIVLQLDLWFHNMGAARQLHYYLQVDSLYNVNMPDLK
jgi:hypothetical protein